jgi:hypothetical protein
MKIRTLGLCLAAVTIVSLYAIGSAAAKNGVDVVALTQETQKVSHKADEMTFVWWIPEEFWKASLAQQKLPADQAEAFLKVFRPYVIVAVVKSKMGLNPSFESEEEVRAKTKVFDNQGKQCAMLSDSDVDETAKTFLNGMLKPVIAKTIGPMGSNMRIMLFSAKGADGKPVVDTTKKGQFKVVVAGEKFRWRLPFDSVLPKQTCSKCKEECKGSWLFCPWCGTKLTKPAATPSP